MNSKNSPGVAYTTQSGGTFYVDTLWAMTIGSQKELEAILSLPPEELGDKLRGLSLDPLMRQTYSIANQLVESNNAGEKKAGKFIDWYYHSLSPKTVPFQFKHPKINYGFKKITGTVIGSYMKLKGIKLLSEEEVFRAKNNLIAFKKINYKGQSNEDIKEFLKRYHEE